MVGATLNGSGFFEGGSRYGVATIKATATKWRDKVNRTGLVAQRSVKLVISEWPFPGPQGPIQSNANLNTGGNYGVHWGKMTAQGDMYVKLPWRTLPWFNAYDRIHFERGYAGFPPMAGGDFVDAHDWLAELQGRQIEDPWFEARARGAIINSGTPADPNPYVKTDLANDIEEDKKSGWSGFMHYQTHSQYPSYSEVIFPRIDYDFWKEIAIQGSASGQEGVYYFYPSCPTCTGDAGEMYTDGASAPRLFAHIVNTSASANPANPGFYFFDSGNRLNPQGVGAPGVLAPPIAVNSGDTVGNDPFLMQGFIYVNADFGTTGIGSGGPNVPNQWLNFPGEPYRDLGFQQYTKGTPDVAWGPPNAGANNGIWDYQDFNENGRFDVLVEQVTRPRPSGGSVTFWVPVPFTPDCTPPGGRDGTAPWNDYTIANCSEPHEPYLNLLYPVNGTQGGTSTPIPLTVGWEGNMVQQRHAKEKVSGNPVDCSAGSMPLNIKLCTSNGYDKYGRLIQDVDPVLIGVMYIEGVYEAQGNAHYFGSLLVNGGVGTQGTPEVWFDERLIKGDWPPADMKFPRVYISSHLTDQ
jgi:hypothetical protein